MDKEIEQSSDSQDSRSKGSGKFSYAAARLLLRILLQGGMPIGLVVLAWWYYVTPWIDSVESRIALTHTAQKNSARLNDVHALQAQLKNLTTELDQLKSKLPSFAKNDEIIKALSQKIIDLERQVEALTKAQSAVLKKGSDGWKQDIISAIQTGSPLTAFRENPAVPQRIRSIINNIDFIPSWGYILEEWNFIKMGVRFSAPSGTIITPTSNWWENFKTFIRGAFRIQRLNKDNKTPEEAFCSQVDVFLSDRDISSLVILLGENKSNIELNSQSKLLAWTNKLDLYRKGQGIIDMVKNIND